MNVEHLPKPEGAWHDATCPEGVDCRSRDEHILGITLGPVLRKFLEEYMPGAIARHNEYRRSRIGDLDFSRPDAL